MGIVIRALFGLAVLGLTAASFLVEDAPNFQRPELARIFFFHFPCAILSSVALVIGAIFGYRYLMTRKLEWDVRSAAANELGFLLCILTMATGIIFSRVQWNAWWQWDPRQTSFLVVLLIYAAYFALRGAYPDETKRATFASAYSVFAIIPFLFLTFVFPRLDQVQSFHPNDSVTGGLMKGAYAYVVSGMILALGLIGWWCYQLRVRAGLLELALDQSNGKLENTGGNTAPPRVVRPVSLPPEG